MTKDIIVDADLKRILVKNFVGNQAMITSLIDRLRGKSSTKADNALNYTYLHLYQAQRNHDFVEIMIEGDEVAYQSMILASDPAERTILMDELFPTGFEGLSGQKVHLAIRQKGGRNIKFETIILQQHSYDDVPIVVLAMPQDIETGQRRNAYRLPINDAMTIGSRFVAPGGHIYHGSLRNVSSTGIAVDILLDDDVGANFQYSDILDELVFDFAGTHINCEATVRNINVGGADKNHLLIGAEFVDLPLIQQRLLERSIMRIQRDRIKLSGVYETDIALA